MVGKYIPCIIIGISIGISIGTYLWSKKIDAMMTSHYVSQKALINTFYAELADQSNKFFKIMREYIKKEENND